MKCKGCGVSLDVEEFGIGIELYSCYIKCLVCGTIHCVKCRYGSGQRKTVKIVNQIEPHKIFFEAKTA